MKSYSLFRRQSITKLRWQLATLALLSLAACSSNDTPVGLDALPDPPEKLEWRQLGRTPVSNDLLDVFERDGVALAVGIGGDVAVRKGLTEDWFAPARVTEDVLRVAHISSTGHLFAAARNCIIRTKEAGGSWTVVLEEENPGFASIASEDNIVVAVGRDIFTSDDNGATWTETTPTTLFGVFTHVSALGDGIFLALTTEGDLFRSEDNGATWPELIADPPVDFFANAMNFFDDANGIVVRANSPRTTLLTDTGGKSWSPVAELNDFLRDLSTFGTQFALALHPNSILRTSNDGGASFSAEIQADRSLLGLAQAAHAIDESRWLLVGPNGVIIETTDGGATWQDHTRGLLRSFCGLGVSESGVAVALLGECDFDFGPGVAISSNGGRDWTLVENLFPGDDPQAVAFHGERGIIVTNRGRASLTNDGGLNWNPSVDLSTSGLSDAVFIDNETMRVIASNGEILGSSNGGNSFEPVFDTGGAFLRRIVHFPGTSVLVITGSTMMRSTDLGESWTILDTQGLDPAFDMFATDANTAYALTGEATLLKTTDAGLTWPVALTLSGIQMKRVVFSSTLHGVILTNEGVMQTLDGGENWEFQDLDVTLELFSLAADPSGGMYVGGRNGVLFEGFVP